MRKTKLNNSKLIAVVMLLFCISLFVASFAGNGGYANAATYPQGNLDELDFTIDTGEYVNGICATEANIPVITLRLIGEQYKPSHTTFWYTEQDTIGIPPEDASWKEIVDIDKTDDQAQLYMDNITQSNEFYSKYIYFKTVIAKQDEGSATTYYYEHVNTQFVDMLLDRTLDSSGYSIRDIQTTYKDGEVDVPYNTDNPSWVSSSITFKITSNNINSPSTQFYFSFKKNEQGLDIWQPATIQGEAGDYYAVATISETYRGQVKFSSSNMSATINQPYGAHKYIMLDTKVPAINVKAEKDIPNATEAEKRYVIGSYSAHDIIYTVTPIADGEEELDESLSGSGARYFYHTGDIDDNGDRVWNEMTAINGVYTLIINSTTPTLMFKGVSNAGKDSSLEEGATGSSNYATFIDKVKPKLNLVATDGKGNTIRSLGTMEGAGYKVGYATDSIKFVLTNSSNNESKVSFEYMVVDEDDTYKEKSNISPYELIISQAFVNRTYKFQVSSQSGLTDIVEFTVSVLKSNFSFEFAKDIEVNTNANGWAKYEIPVQLTLPAILNLADEYDFYTEITGNPTSVKKMSADRIDTFTGANGVLYSTYQIFIDRSLNNQKMDFYAINRAGDSSPKLTTPFAIKLDLVTPQGVVQKRLYNSTVVLSDDDWANGRVVIEITPSTNNISGVRCYPLLGNQRGKEIIADGNGMFIYQVSVTGTYNFVLVSGADGVAQDPIRVSVNIDTSDILFNNLSASIEEIAFDANGNEHLVVKDLALTQNNTYYEVNQTVSRDVYINFMTNHDGHFTFYYQQYTGTAPSESGYSHMTNSQFFVIPISEFESTESGEVNYAFYLESKAINGSGEKKFTQVRYIRIKYNIKDFSISVEYLQGSSSWTNSDVDFVINITDGVDISEYQMHLVMQDGTDLGWRNITSYVRVDDPTEPNKVTYTFGGVEMFSNNNISLGYAYNGKVFFRAINTAGRVSPIVGDEITVQMDKSTPNPVHAIKQSSGAEIVSRSTGEFAVYSNTTISLIPTNNNNEKPVFANLAPITYYYAPATTGTAPSSESAYTVLTTTTQLTGGYWIFAKNSLNAISSTQRYNFIVERNKPMARLSATDAAIGISGIYEFNWQDMAKVTLSVTSETAVYYWYKIGTGEWAKYNTQAEAAGGFKDIIFVGEYNPLYPNAIIGNIDETVEFRVTNLSGSISQFEADALVRIRIDVRTPNFDFTTTIYGDEIDRDRWQPNEIFINIFPAETQRDAENNEILVPIDPVTANPGGVVYTYRLDPTQPFVSLPGDGTFFSTNDLATAVAGSSGFDGNGMVTIYLRATAKESRKIVDKSITLYIDSVKPDFELLGEITPPGTTNTLSISSGTWTQADEVRISKYIKAVSKSPVTYTYYTSNNVHNISPWNDNNPLIRKDISTLYVTATNGAGLTVSKTFDVKIDNVAPLINSGIIRNAMVNNGGVEEIDRLNPNTYYIDQAITYIEPNLKHAYYNNFTLPNGYIIATDTVDNSNTGGLAEGKGGYVHIIVEDKAGNKSELIFYMTVFELTVNNITLSEEHKDLLNKFEEQFEEGKSGLTQSRRAYFESQINRLNDRLATLQKQIDEYRAFLLEMNNKSLFTLIDDYHRMKTYINYFETRDETILYPEWQQKMIKQGDYGLYYDKMEREYRKLDNLMTTVLRVEREVSALPPANVVVRADYTNIVKVFNLYDSMSGIQKEMVNPSLFVKLTNVKKQCEVLLLRDEATGIKITGNDLAPGVALEVISYDKTTELVNNAQLTLLETMPQSAARAIMYVKKLDIDSQYITGDIIVTLPIPEEYQNYIGFGVYKLSSDGTVAPINDITISGSGKSVSFAANSLDTYIMAVNAEPTVRQPSEKIYGKVGDIEIDATLLTYITYSAVAMFAVLLIVLIFIGVRHRVFLKKYNKSYRKSLVKRGINKIPKGNPPARSNPATGDKMDYSDRVYQDRK